MPPEWAPHRATWLSWPHNRETWPDELAQVERTMAEVVRLLIERGTVPVVGGLGAFGEVVVGGNALATNLRLAFGVSYSLGGN